MLGGNIVAVKKNTKAVVVFTSKDRGKEVVGETQM
jgi:hypothetical protein